MEFIKIGCSKMGFIRMGEDFALYMAKKTAKQSRVKKTVEPELVELGKRIRQLRIERGYSNADIFAYENNLSRTAYGQYERGANITYMSLRRLLDVFGITVQEFFAPFKK